MDELNFLKSQIEKRIANINNTRSYYRKVSFWTYGSISTLAALSTIALGLNIEHLGESPRIFALIISGLITVLSAYTTFFNHKELWVANNNALNSLRKLKFDIEYKEQNLSGLDTKLTENFKKEYQRILDNLNNSWNKSRSN